MRVWLVALGLCSMMIALAPAVAGAGGGRGGGGTVSANEPLSLGLTAMALLGASMLRRRR